MGELSNLPNIGKNLEEQLNKVGIYTYEDLKKVGSEQAWLRIKAIDSSACYNRLCSFEGAINKIPKKLLSEKRKKELKDFYNSFK